MSAGTVHAREGICTFLADSALLREAVESLKVKPRSGWLLRGIPDDHAETIWEHSKKASRAAEIFFARRNPSKAKYAAFMLTWHDVVEHGANIDYTPHDKIKPETKHALEEQALLGLFADPPLPYQKKIIQAWGEFEGRETDVAVINGDLDKIDAGIQAMVYWLEGYREVDDFFPYAQAKIVDPELKEIFDEVLRRLRDGSLRDPYSEYFYLLEHGIAK